MSDEVTIEEIKEHYLVKLKMRQDTAWVKHIDFITKQDEVISGRLRWDENTGYEMFWDDVPPAGLMELADSPEFEYAIDSETEAQGDGYFMAR